jgi:hypothetical protein
MHAKYVERKGFCVNHLYGTEMLQQSSVAASNRKPEKKAAGIFFNKKN